MSSKKLVAFVDRDGTIIEEPEDFQIDTLSKVRLVDEVIPALRKMIRAGYELVLVSNQDGLGTDSFPKEDFQESHSFLITLLESQGIRFTEEFICPHFESENCNCRKPRTGLLTQYLLKNSIDVERSCVIGDRTSDVELANALGLKAFQVGTGNGEYTWPHIAQALMGHTRTATVVRKTNETDIRVSVNLDSDYDTSIITGIGFFDHMLEQLSKHGGFSINLQCKGDLQTGPHHTIEDCALALGEAMRTALGNKVGLQRYGFTLPMDDALSSAALDLSGRPFCQIDMDLTREMVGDMPTEMVSHFFNSLCQTLGANLHLTTNGSDTHHQVESSFKVVGRALRQALQLGGGGLPTTKGML
ncbi:MAG: bifunctional histidinol-phosphatase/imidazoleglycerol-phosphate dehydratase HisB [Gammaproteobacteria bacterium]